MRIHAHSLRLVVLLLVASPATAQQPVSPVPDALSYGTALVNPAIAAYKAARSSDPMCRLSQLGIAELVGNGTALTLKRLVRSPRPCAGCAPDGFPSGHTMNSTIGSISAGWQVGLTFTAGTGGLRMAAHRHTPWQVLAGAAIGLGADAAGHLLKCDP